MEATGRHSLGVALALHDGGHVVSVVNPAQIRDFARTKLGRNKTDKVDAALIREYAGLFKPGPWAPPSTAMRRLCELQTIRAGIVSNRAEWQNRIGSGLADGTATRLAAATIEHFTSQLKAIDKAIAETIDQDAELRGRRDLLLSVVGVGEAAGRLLLTEMPEPGVLRRSGEMVAYAGLNPSHHRSGTSIDRPTRISKIGNATLRASLYMPALSAMRFNPAVKALVTRLKSAGRLKPKQIVVAAMRQALVICFGVLKTGEPFDPTIAHTGLYPGILPIPLFDWELIIPPSRSCLARPARAAEVKEGRRPATARLVLDRSEPAGMLNEIEQGRFSA